MSNNNPPTAAEVAARILEVVDYQDTKAYTEQVIFAMSHAKFLAWSWQKQEAEIERLRFALHAVGFALGGKDLTADDVDNECLRFNVGTALKYITNTEQGLDVFGRAPSEKGGEG